MHDEKYMSSIGILTRQFFTYSSEQLKLLKSYYLLIICYLTIKLFFLLYWDIGTIAIYSWLVKICIDPPT